MLTDTILKGDHTRIISAKFGWDWLSSFRGEDFFLISSPFFLFLAWRPSWLEVGITGHILEGGHSTKVWLQLAQWFLRRRFLCEFPIGSYVKLSSAVGAILVEGQNRQTYFWKRIIQWLFHQHFSSYWGNGFRQEDFYGNFLCWIKFGCGGHLGRRSKMSDTILEGDHPRIISANFWLRLDQ